MTLFIGMRGVYLSKLEFLDAFLAAEDVFFAVDDMLVGYKLAYIS